MRTESLIARGVGAYADAAAAAPIEISIVVPVHNEAAGIEVFFSQLLPVLERLGTTWEVICINDGSADATLDQLVELHRRTPAIKVISLSRNFGKDVALSAGFDFARGAAVIPIDADLQDPPELIGTMVAKWREGFDIVFATRTRREGDSWFKRTTARYFYQVFDRITDVPIPHDTGDYRLIDRRVVDVLVRLPERTRFMKGLFAWVGFRQAAITFDAQPRRSGETKWNYWRLWNFALDAITSFSSLPLKIWSYLASGDFALRLSLRAFPGRPQNNSRHRFARLCLTDGRGAVLRRRAADLPRHHRRVPRAHVQRGQGPPALSRARFVGLRGSSGASRAMDPSLYPQMAEVEDAHWWFASRRAIVDRIIERLDLPRRCRDSGAGMRHRRKFPDARAARPAVRDRRRRKCASVSPERAASPKSRAVSLPTKSRSAINAST